MTSPGPARRLLDDDFDEVELDTEVWSPHYLPAWSSRAASRATYALRGSALHLSIPAGQGVWCAGDHEPPIRVSGVQSGSGSGPVGSTAGQQPWREGQVVREEQPWFLGFTPAGGRVEMVARTTLSPRSMASLWMVGLEDRPQRCAEICVMEVFGDAVAPGESAAVGMGLHAFRDPGVQEDFTTVRLPLDVAEPHSYAVEWDASVATWSVDGGVVRRCERPPVYPVQLMLAVFDFPDRSVGGDDHLVPELVVDRITGVDARLA